MSTRRSSWLVIGATVATLASALAYANRERIAIIVSYAILKLRGGYTLEERLQQFGALATARLASYFEAADVTFPPTELTFVVFKDQRTLEIFARNNSGSWRFIRTYPILGTSGQLGPKLREGDRQIPEGIYRVVFLNPNSMYHVSLRLDYPNAFDHEMALADGREHLGTDIMIHGKTSSIGCLAMGDEAAEDLFTLTALTKSENVTVLISPTDLRRSLPSLRGQPAWTQRLYEVLRAQLVQFSREA